MEKPMAHTDLLVDLNKELGQDDFQNMKGVVKAKDLGNLKSGELEKLTSVRLLLEKLEHKRVIEVGKYDKLRIILHKIDMESLYTLIERAEDKLRKQGLMPANYSPPRADFPDQASGVVAMDTSPPVQLNTNNSRKLKQKPSFDDAIPSDINPPVQVMESRPRYEQGRGYALFINNFVEEAHDKRYIRDHCKIDETKLEKLFDEYLTTYKFVIKEDLSKRKLMKILKETQGKLRDGRYKCFFLVLCSHGVQNISKENSNMTEERVLMVDGESITEEELTAPFLGEELKEFKDKPKVFLIQACRSPKPREVSDDLTGEHSGQATGETEARPPSLSCPVNANVLISYAASKGEKAWRNEVTGSWFIHHFCEVAKKWHEKEHLMDMLVRVNDKVAQMETDVEGAKQMPCQVTTLTKDLWL